MTIEDAERIDIIGIDAATGDVILTIANHLDWSDEYEHLTTLQKKLNAYLAFIESGEINETYPKARARRPIIDVVFKYEPSATATEFLRHASSAAASIGAELRSRVKQ